ncbi:hypothetical protein N7533_001709 [Penicillium manginii]|uniref:uncharacterized protein n=1 Tax=Penicillium manginii TaxID=203109 RepID=UPI0025493E70|nr:uncharacterized protein N7533_001709 [Penicillium manginii]KAJ5763028.1 hypothetical protein N7533_001709 [Penicillium manginii]
MKINELTDQLEKCGRPATLLADDLLTKDRGITSRTSDVQIRYDNSAHLPRIHSLMPAELQTVPPSGNASSEPMDLLDFSSMEDDASATTKTWTPQEFGSYFVTDQLNLLARIAEATHTNISIVTNSDPLQISLVGLTAEDVDEALEKLQATLAFIGLLQEPLSDVVVLGSNDEIPRYQMKKLIETNRATGERLVEDLSMRQNPKTLMIPYPQAPAIVTISPMPQAATTIPQQSPLPARTPSPATWNQSDFPKLGTPAPKSSQQNISGWPASSTPNAGPRFPPRQPFPPARGMQSSTRPQVKTAIAPQSEIGKFNSPKFLNIRKTRKLANVTDENTGPGGLSPSSPLASAPVIGPQQERSPTPETTISSVPSRGSELRSPSPASLPSETTAPNSSPPTPPPARYASRPGSPESFVTVSRPEFNPGTHGRPARVRFPTSLPSDAATLAVGKRPSGNLEKPGNVRQPSNPIATPLVRRPAEPAALNWLKPPVGLPVPSIPERSSSKRPPVPAKPPKLRVVSGNLSTALKDVPESQTLVDFNAMNDETKPANLCLTGEEMTDKKCTTDTVTGNDPPSSEKLFDVDDISFYMVGDEPIIPCLELPMPGPPGTVSSEPVNKNAQEQARDQKQESNVQMAMDYLCRAIQINGSTSPPEIAETPEPRDSADDSPHEALAAVSELETRELHTAMNQRSARLDIDQESKNQARAESKARHLAKKNDMWGLVTFHHSNVAKAKLLEKGGGSSERSSSKHSTSKRSRSKDRTKTVFHMLEPVLTAARAFPGRIALEVQIGLMLVPPNQPSGIMDLNGLRRYFNPNTGLPPPKPFLSNRLAIDEGGIDQLIDLRVDGCRIFDEEPFEETIDCEFHCILPKVDTVESFLVTVFNDEPARTTGPNFPLGNIHLNFPDNIWDAAIVLTGQSPFVNLDEKTKEGILKMTKEFRKIFSGADIKIETTALPPPVQIKKILMKRVSKYRYLRAGDKEKKEDLYMRITENQDLVISYSFDKTTIKAYCPSESDKVNRPHSWLEVSLISSGTEDALESNWKLEVGSQTSKWNTATLFGQGTAPPSSSASSSSSPDLIDAPGLWSLFGLTEIVVKNIDEIGSRKETSAAAPEPEVNAPSKSLVVTGSSGQDQIKSLRLDGGSRLKEHEENPHELRYW